MLSKNIKNARKAKGVSQEELAEKLHVVRQTVSKWENGLSVPDAEVLLKIADVLEVPAGALLGAAPADSGAEALTEELARLKKQLAALEQEKALYIQAGKRRGVILLLAFAAMVLAMGVKNELVSIVLLGGCVLAALVILYKSLPLLTKTAAPDLKMGALKITTVFSIVVWTLTVAVIALDKAAILRLSASGEELFALALVSAVILFGGFISPKLPFNRHTGLRLPWTVQDEDTWNVAHKLIGYISLPLELLYLAAFFTVSDFAAVSTAVILLWIGIPSLISFLFWRKKYHGGL